MIAPRPGRDAGGERRLVGVATPAGRGAELLDGRAPGAWRRGAGTSARRARSAVVSSIALELVEERELLPLLLGVLGDLLALALDVRGRDLGLGALGQERSGRHRQRRRDRARQPGGQHGARAAGRAGNAGDDPEHRGQPVVGAVDRARDPAAAGPVPLLAPEDPVEPGAGARYSQRRGVEARARSPICAPVRSSTDPEPARMSCTASACERSSLRMSRSSPSVTRVAGRALVEVVDLLVLGRLARGEQPVDRRDPGLEAEPQRDAHAVRVGHVDSSSRIRSSSRVRWPPSACRHPPQDLGLPLGHALARSARRPRRRRSRLATP